MYIQHTVASVVTVVTALALIMTSECLSLTFKIYCKIWRADWRAFFWKFVHLTMLVMCIYVMEYCLIFSRAVFHFLMPSVVHAVLFLHFSEEKATTKTVD